MAAVETWLITLVVVVVVVAVLVAVTATRRARRRQDASAIGLPPIGAVGGDGPPVVAAPEGDAQEVSGLRRAAADARATDGPAR